MKGSDLMGLIVAVAVFCYLLYALLRSERL
jgi:K+-transporting ATPase KdpF subunit